MVVTFQWAIWAIEDQKAYNSFSCFLVIQIENSLDNYFVFSSQQMCSVIVDKFEKTPVVLLMVYIHYTCICYIMIIESCIRVH